MGLEELALEAATTVELGDPAGEGVCKVPAVTITVDVAVVVRRAVVVEKTVVVVASYPEIVTYCRIMVRIVEYASMAQLTYLWLISVSFGDCNA